MLKHAHTHTHSPTVNPLTGQNYWVWKQIADVFLCSQYLVLSIVPACNLFSTQNKSSYSFACLKRILWENDTSSERGIILAVLINLTSLPPAYFVPLLYLVCSPKNKTVNLPSRPSLHLLLSFFTVSLRFRLPLSASLLVKETVQGTVSQSDHSVPQRECRITSTTGG